MHAADVNALWEAAMQQVASALNGADKGDLAVELSEVYREDDADRIADGWMLVLAGNPTEYNAAASTLDAVTADRMRMIRLRPDYDAWRAYTHRGIHPIVLSYLEDHKRQFYVSRSRRVTAKNTITCSFGRFLRQKSGNNGEVNLFAAAPPFRYNESCRK